MIKILLTAATVSTCFIGLMTGTARADIVYSSGSSGSSSSYGGSSGYGGGFGGSSGTTIPGPVTSIPEPTSLVLLGSGLVALGVIGRFRAKKD